MLNMRWFAGAACAFSLAAAAPQSPSAGSESESESVTQSANAKIAGLMASYTETQNFVFFNFVVNEYEGDEIVRQSYCTELNLDLDAYEGEITSECTQKDLDIGIIEGEITLDHFKQLKAAPLKGMPRPIAEFYYRLNYVEDVNDTEDATAFLFGFRKPNADSWSEDVEVKSNEWNTIREDGLIKNLWRPEKVDKAEKRIIRGF